MKFCKGCGVMRPLSEFGREKKSRDKLAYKCRACNLLDLVNRYRAEDGV